MSEEYELVFDPRGRVETARITPAPRVASLDGKRLGVLDNTKWNGNKLLRKTAARLEHLPQGELLESRRPHPARYDRRRQRHRPDRDRRLRVVYIVLYA